MPEDTLAAARILAAAATAEEASAESQFWKAALTKDESGWDVTVIGPDGSARKYRTSLDGTLPLRGPKVKRPRDASGQSKLRALALQRAGLADALAEALARYPGAEITSVSYGKSSPHPRWKVSLRLAGAEARTVKVDAVTGKTLR